MNKTNTVLALLLIGQIVAILVVVSPFGGADTATVERVSLVDTEVDSVLSVTITDEGEEPLEIAKQGGAWVLASADGYPVDEALVEPLIQKILGMKTGRPVTRHAKNHKQLEVAESKYQRKIELAGDGGKAIATLYLGESPNYNQQNVRRSDSDVVYLVSGVAPADFSTTPSRWVDSQWFSVGDGDITSFELTQGDETVAASRAEDGAWRMTKPREAAVAVADVDPVLRGWKNVYLTEPVGKDDGSYGFEAPTAVLEFTVVTTPDPGPESDAEEAGADGETPAADPEPVISSRRLVIGAETEGGYFAKHDGSEFVVTLTAGSVEQKFLKSADDFAPPPAEEASEDAEAPGEPGETSEPGDADAPSDAAADPDPTGGGSSDGADDGEESGSESDSESDSGSGGS